MVAVVARFLRVVPALLLLAACADNPDRVSPSAPHAAAASLGNDLAGEACHSVVGDKSSAQSGGTALEIVCGEHDSVAGVVYTRPWTGSTGRDAIEQAAAAARADQGANALVSCEAGRWLDAPSGGGLVIAPCTLIDGAWPQIEVTYGGGGLLFQAQGPPALLPVIIRAFAVTGGQPLDIGAPASSVAALQQFLGRNGPNYASSALGDYRNLVHTAQLDDGVGNAAAAEAAYRHALEIETQVFGAAAPGSGEILLCLALEVSDQGRYDEAADLFRRATPIIDASPDPLLRARLASYEALDAANQGHFAEARQAALQASDLRRGVLGGMAAGEPSPNRGELAQSLSIEAAADLRLGDMPSAEAAAAEALDIISGTPDLPLWWRPNAIALMGQINTAESRFAFATHDFHLALAERQRLFGDTLPTAISDMELGRLFHAQDMPDETVKSYRAAFAILDKDRSAPALFGFDQLAPFFAAAGTLSDSDAKERPALEADMVRAIQLTGGGVGDQTIARASVRLAAADPTAASLSRQLQEAQLKRDSARIQLVDATARSNDERSGTQEASLLKAIVSADDGVDLLQQKLRQVFPAYDKLANPGPASLDELRARLHPGEAVIVFAFGREMGAGVLVGADRFLMRKLDVNEAQLATAVADLRKAFVPVGSSLPDFNIDEAHRLYAGLLAPFEPGLGGITKLTIVTSGPLASLPLGVLVTSAPATGHQHDYAHASWLVRRFALSEVPSLRALVTLRAADAVTAPSRKPYLGFGDPAFGGAASGTGRPWALAEECREDGPVAAATLAALPRLPETADEVTTVARLAGAGPDSIFLGTRASESNLRGLDLEQYAVLYFATHGILPGELHCAAEPGLALSPPAEPAKTKAEDGFLEADEIAGLKLNADLVVLSACNTAENPKELGGEALSGVAEAFFYAGARSVLASHWQVSSKATVQLMTGLFTAGQQGDGVGVADALQQSQLALLDRPATSHPFFWGAFVLIGDGGRSLDLHGTKPVRSAQATN